MIARLFAYIPTMFGLSLLMTTSVVTTLLVRLANTDAEE